MLLANRILHKLYQHLAGVQAWTLPTGLYVGFTKTTPDAEGFNVTEPPLAAGYGARPSIYGPALWTPPVGGIMQTAAPATFAVATSDWSDLVGAVWYETASGIAISRFVGFEPFPSGPFTVPAGQIAQYAAGEIRLVPIP